MKKRITMLLSAMVLVCLFALPVSAKSTTINGNAVSTVAPGNTKITVDYTYDSSSNCYLGNDPDYSTWYYNYGVVIPIKINSKGILYGEITNYLDGGTENAFARLYKDAECTHPYYYSGSETFSHHAIENRTDTYTTYNESSAYINAAGTYYLRIYSRNSIGTPKEFTGSGKYSLRFISSADRGLSVNQTVTSFSEVSGVYFKINVDKSGYLNVIGRSDQNYLMSVQLCNSKKKVVSNGQGYLDKETNFTNTYKVDKGTYYIYMSGSADHPFTIKYTFQTTINASNNKAITLTPANSKQSEYVKIKPNKTGYIKLTAYKYAAEKSTYGTVTLCNSKQKVLTDSVIISSGASNNAVFAVKKNETYYIKVNSGDPFRFKYTVSGISEKSGSKASKAVNIKKGNTVKGTILAGENKVDYYKITLNKAQKVNLIFDGKTSSGAIKFEIYSNKKCTTKYYVGNGLVNSIPGADKFTSKGKLRKGTYYVKVMRYDAKSSGYYSVKWKK